MSDVTTYADGFGTWHAEVKLGAKVPRTARRQAVAAITRELQERAPRDVTVPEQPVTLVELTLTDSGLFYVFHYTEA